MFSGKNIKLFLETVTYIVIERNVKLLLETVTYIALTESPA